MIHMVRFSSSSQSPEQHQYRQYRSSRPLRSQVQSRLAHVEQEVVDSDDDHETITEMSSFSRIIASPRIVSGWQVSFWIGWMRVWIRVKTLNSLLVDRFSKSQWLRIMTLKSTTNSKIGSWSSCKDFGIDSKVTQPRHLINHQTEIRTRSPTLSRRPRSCSTNASTPASILRTSSRSWMSWEASQ